MNYYNSFLIDADIEKEYLFIFIDLNGLKNNNIYIYDLMLTTDLMD